MSELHAIPDGDDCRRVQVEALLEQALADVRAHPAHRAVLILQRLDGKVQYVTPWVAGAGLTEALGLIELCKADLLLPADDP
jgi:hypothetical protein